MTGGWRKRTSHLLLLEGHVLVVQLAGGLLLGFLVVDGVGAGYSVCQSLGQKRNLEPKES